MVLQLHARANMYVKKDLHDAYIEARQELEKRIKVWAGDEPALVTKWAEMAINEYNTKQIEP